MPKQSRGELCSSSERPSHGRLELVRKRSRVSGGLGAANGMTWMSWLDCKRSRDCAVR